MVDDVYIVLDPFCPECLSEYGHQRKYSSHDQSLLVIGIIWPSLEKRRLFRKWQSTKKYWL